MLADNKIDSLETHLGQFKLNNQTSQNDLQSLLKEYGQLLDDYKNLRKAFDAKGSKPVPKVMSQAAVATTKAVEAPRNPYVLVLIDGNGYIFNDKLIREREEGGMRAARMLNDAVEKYLQQSVPQARTARIVVKIYADLTTLSKQLAKSKLIGMEKRSLAPFSAAFTRAISLFDFVDSLDEEGSKFKIREQFKIASEDAACSHVLLAACHDSAYLSQLVPFSGVRDKITLVQGAGWNPEFHNFNLNVTEFPTVFRWSKLPAAVPSTKTAQSNGHATPKPKVAPKKETPIVPTGPRQSDSWSTSTPLSLRSSIIESEATSDGFGSGNGVSVGSKHANTNKLPHPCKFFQKGFCRFGNKCSFQHVPSSVTGTNKDNDNTPDHSSISAELPVSCPPNHIPLNKDSHRIDTYIRPPTQEEWSIYNARFRQQKPCNSFHLQRVCTMFGCPYDHQDLEPESRHVLEYVLKCSPCPRKGSCRASDCYYGHVCQKDGCQGQMKGCRMKADLHAVDPKMASCVMVDEEVELVHGQMEVVHGQMQMEGVSVGVGVGASDESRYLW